MCGILFFDLLIHIKTDARFLREMCKIWGRYAGAALFSRVSVCLSLSAVVSLSLCVCRLCLSAVVCLSLCCSVSCTVSFTTVYHHIIPSSDYIIIL